jgi:outer membrane protein OmpA-like peptidoglycan-associated protein
VAPNATVYNRNTVDVGCNLNAGSVRSCTITAYYHGKPVGTGVAGYSRFGHQHTVVHVALNALGQRLLHRAQGGLPVNFTAKARPLGLSVVLGAKARSVLFEPLRFMLDDVLFDFNSATLTPQAHAIVAQLAQHLHGISAVRCEGYTDNVGDPAYNMALGLHRAQAVCSLLRSLGVHARFRVATYGQSRPVASNSTSTGRHTNRCVVVRVSYHDLP